MKELYFKGNFYAFINEFTKYLSEEEVYLFLTLLDKLCLDRLHENIYTKEEFQEALTMCTNLLTKAYSNKLKNIEGKSLEEKQELLLEFIYDFQEPTYDYDENTIMNLSPTATVIEEEYYSLKNKQKKYHFN